MRKPPTMDDVARAAGVSRALVSLVMRDSPQVSDRRRTAVLRAAEQLGYRPNILARNLASRRTDTIGVLVNDIHNPFFAEVIDGIEAEADGRDLAVLILNGGRDIRRERRAVDSFLALRVEGIVLVGSGLDDDDLSTAGDEAPTVVVAAGVRDGVDTINVDEALGTDLAVDHLAALGHRSIAYLDGGDGIAATDRRDGYVAAMLARDLVPQIVAAGRDQRDAAAAIAELGGEGREGREGGADGEGRLPTAVFAFNDLLAAGVLDVLGQLSIPVPQRVSVVGYDNTFIAAHHHMALTTVNQPRERMGRHAVEALAERLDGGRHEPVHRTIAPELVVRRSTASPDRDAADWPEAGAV